MSEIKGKDLTELYDQMWRQVLEDRDLVLKGYNDLKSQTITKEEYVMQGLVLSKFAELCIKQTSQLIEVIRINQKEVKKGDVELDDEDKKEIFNAIGN